MDIHIRFDDERLIPLLHRVVALCTPRGLSAEDEDRIYWRLRRAVERAEAAAAK